MVALPLELPTRNTTRRRYARDVQSLSNVALWLRLNEQQNYTVVNSGTSGSALNGTWTPGNGDVGHDGYRTNDAYLFDKKKSKIVIANHADLGNMTTQAWGFRIKATSLGLSNLGHLFGWLGGAFSSNLHYATLSSSNRFAVVIDTNSTSAVAESSVNQVSNLIGAWAWIFFDYDDANTLGNGRRIRIWKAVNGVLSALTLGTNQAATGTVTPMTQPLGIGNTTTSVGTFDGLIDEVICRPASLWTTAEMQMLVDGTQQFRSAARILADDTRELQVLLDAGGTVNLDTGRTYYSRRLLVSPSIVEGNDATIISLDGNNNAVLRNKNVDTGDTGITIRNLNVEGNSANQENVNTCHGFAFYKATNVTLENCISNDNERDGFYFGGGAIDGFTLDGGCNTVVMNTTEAHDNRRNGISVIRLDTISVDGFIATGNNAGVPDNATYDAATIDFEPNNPTDPIQHVELANFDIRGGYSPAVVFAGSFTATKDDIHIHNGYIESTSEYGIAAFTVITNAIIEDNEIHVNGIGGIWLHGQTFIIDGVEVNRNQIFGNDTALQAGIGLNYVNNAVIDDNHVTDFAKAVLVFASDTVDIINNEFTSCATSIDITGGSTNVTQSNNTVN